MAGKRRPTEKVVADGKKHFTSKELAERTLAEPKGPGDIRSLRAPQWLKDEAQRKEFGEISRQLVALLPRLLIRYDAESIAAFVRYRAQWLRYSDEVDALFRGQFPDLVALEAVSKLQDRAFKACRSLAGDLGLTLSARCQLVIPQMEQKEEDPLDQLLSSFGGDDNG